MKTTVIYHSADFDGIFCREIARKFLGDQDVEYIGWNFGDAPVPIPNEGKIYVMDLPVDRVFGFQFKADYIEWPDGKAQPIEWYDFSRWIWIDHHKSSIETHLLILPGYRIDGVAACRLAWQWFTAMVSGSNFALPGKGHFVDRQVSEPMAVRLAGEYDIWDKRDPYADVLQFGLRSVKDLDWSLLLGTDAHYLGTLLERGHLLQSYQRDVDASVVRNRSFLVKFEGLTFLALNTARCNSLTFAALDVPETGHDALMSASLTSKGWSFSLYHAKHRTDLDLSAIAVKYGGGGHRGACGFQAGSTGGLNIVMGSVE